MVGNAGGRGRGLVAPPLCREDDFALGRLGVDDDPGIVVSRVGRLLARYRRLDARVQIEYSWSALMRSYPAVLLHACARGLLPFDKHNRERAFRRDAAGAQVLSGWAVGRLGSELPSGLNGRLCRSRICGQPSGCVLPPWLISVCWRGRLLLPGVNFSDLVSAGNGLIEIGGRTPERARGRSKYRRALRAS